MPVRRPQAIGRDLLAEVLDAKLLYEGCPPWLLRPGREECRNAWALLSNAYRALTRRALPAEPPSRERRRVDVIAAYPDGTSQIFEIDERQHFTQARVTTLDLYPPDVRIGFPIDRWRAEALRLAGREPGGGFARPCPPLFPDPGGRHQQRAFRDMLADLLPPEHGWRPTVRIAEFELSGGLLAEPRQASAFLKSRLVPAEFVRRNRAG